MILICENCQTRYQVSSYTLEPDGRTVRCSRCSHEWFQPPEEEVEILRSEEEDFAPIPESVKPLPEDSSVPLISEEETKDKNISEKPIAVVAGAGAALLVGVLLLGILFMVHRPLTSIWPASASFFELLGVEQNLPGETLIFDRVKAYSTQAEDGTVSLDVEGRLLNLSEFSTDVPDVMATVRMEDGEEGESWIFKAADGVLQPGGETYFQAEYNELHGPVKELVLQLVVGKQKAAAGNTEENGHAKSEASSSERLGAPDPDQESMTEHKESHH